MNAASFVNKVVFHAGFKKAIAISLLWHVSVFSIFNVTFGKKLLARRGGVVSFLGEIIPRSGLAGGPVRALLSEQNNVLMKRAFFSVKKLPQADSPSFACYLKPAASPVFLENKVSFTRTSSLAAPPKKGKESVLMFYPPLPSQVALYFKDRQTVHIELLFNPLSSGSAFSLIIKRKISSGNLDVDLLAMRYIGHYLFMQQNRLTPNTWHTVKIDLSTKKE